MTTSLRDVSSRSGFALASGLARAFEGERVRVGTENQAKRLAVTTALRLYLADDDPIDVCPTDVPSDVPEQPLGWDQIVSGARNRARHAFSVGDCVLAVGIEDGLVRTMEGSGATETPQGSAIDLSGWMNLGCAFVTDGEREGHGFSSGFAYPRGALEPAIRDQEPIGDLFDDHWSRYRALPETAHGAAESVPSGRSGGNIGRLTGGRLERSGYGSHAVINALIRFLHTDLYD